MMTQGWQWIKQHVSPLAVVIGLTLLIAAPIVFGPFVAGYGDNGTMMAHVAAGGLFVDGHQPSGYTISTYAIQRYFNEHAATVPTASSLVVNLAVAINRLLISTTHFDVRVLGALHFGLYLAGLSLLTLALTAGKRCYQHYLIALMLVFVFADSSLTLYFNSFYPDALIAAGLMGLVGSILLISRQQPRWWLLLAFFFSAVLLITSTPRAAVLAVGVAVAGLGLLVLPRFFVARSVIVVALIGLLGLGAATLPKRDAADRFDSFSTGVLAENPNPGPAIEALGIDRQYALVRYQDYTPSAPVATLPSDKRLVKPLIKKLSFGWLVTYYWNHPAQFSRLLDVVAKNLMNVHQRHVTQWTKAAVKRPNAQLHYFTGASWLMATFFPERAVFLVMAAFVVMMVMGVGYFNDRRNHQIEGLPRLWLVLGLWGNVLLVPVSALLISGTANVAYHLFSASISVTLILIIMIADALTGRLWQALGTQEEESE